MSDDLETAVFGKQVEMFLSGEVGRYLLGRAESQAVEAMDKLKTTASWRRKRIQELQNEIAVCESIRAWLAQAVYAGEQSTRNLELDNAA